MSEWRMLYDGEVASSNHPVHLGGSLQFVYYDCFLLYSSICMQRKNMWHISVLFPSICVLCTSECGCVSDTDVREKDVIVSEVRWCVCVCVWMWRGECRQKGVVFHEGEQRRGGMHIAVEWEQQHGDGAECEWAVGVRARDNEKGVYVWMYVCVCCEGE